MWDLYENNNLYYDKQLKSPNLTTIVIPKVNTPNDLIYISDIINHHHQQQQQQNQNQNQKRQISILALIETAKSLTNINQICKSTPFLQGLIFAAEDFALDLSITRTPSLTEFLFARSSIATAARAADLPSTIDLVCTTYRRAASGADSGGDDPMKVLEDECLNGKQLGFNGKQCIHPSQVETVQRVFGPTVDEVVWAVRVAVADQKAALAGRGAWTLDGKMIDAPVAGKARAIVKKAETCGFEVERLLEEWKDQQPE